MTPRCNPIQRAKVTNSRFFVFFSPRARDDSSPRGASSTGVRRIRPSRRSTSAVTANDEKKLFR